jgi:dihydroorotate dehydrogenase
MDYAKARLEVINAQRHSSSSSSSVSDGIIGINIGKNKTQTDAVADYLAGYRMLAPFADYVTINISSPNTPNLRELQHKEGLRPLLETIAHEKETLCPNTPLWLKIAPDVTETQLQAIIELSLEYNIDALVIGNTTIEGKQMLKDRARNEEGGLSGKPLRDHSTQILRRAYVISEGKIPLIGVGGIASAADAYEKICAGATLVQLYTALIYHGFSLVDQIVNELPLLLEKDGFSCIGDAIGCNAKKNN